MITMVAAVVAALILTLPMLGVEIPTREGKQKMMCLYTHGNSQKIGLNGYACGIILENTDWDRCTESTNPITTKAEKGVYRGDSFVYNARCNVNSNGVTRWISFHKEDFPVPEVN